MTLLQGRLTLLLGPPGGGKSLLLQALSGRLKQSKHLRVRQWWWLGWGWVQGKHQAGGDACADCILDAGAFHAPACPPSQPPSALASADTRCLSLLLQISGSIKYNGVDPSTFVVRRTAGLVEQGECSWQRWQRKLHRIRDRPEWAFSSAGR